MMPVTGPATGLGDQARLFASMRHNTGIRERMATLTQEMSTGVAADMAAHLGGDMAGLADVDRRLALAKGWSGAAKEAANRLGAMQVTLAQAQDARQGLAERLIAATAPGGAAAGRAAAAVEGRGVFLDVAGALNARLGNSALFAGTATGGAALAPGATLMGSIEAAVAGATTAADVTAALDVWFDDPAGGFATVGYLGHDEDVERAVDEGMGVKIAARADHEALRGVLKAAAMAAIAGAETPALPETERAALQAASRDALLSLSHPLATLQATLGAAEGRVEEAQARHAARQTAFGIMRTEMTQADPFQTASELEAVRTQLETHYALTDRLSRLTLVSFLR